jgi:hypothetical protein
MIKRRPRIRSRRDYLLANSPDRRLRILYQIRHWVGVLTVVVTVLFVLFNLQLLTPNSIKNIRSSLTAASQISSSDTTVISYPASSPDRILPFGSGLAVCDNGMLTIELPGSYSQTEMEMPYADPAMRSSDQYLLIFDRNANRYTVTNTLSKLDERTVSSPIIDADIADNGNVAVVTNEAGYKSAVSVYNNIDDEPLYTWSSSDYYIMSAAISSDGSRLALFCFGQDGLTLYSKLFFININVAECPADPEWSTVSQENEDTSIQKVEGVDMGGSLCMGLRFIGRNTVCVVCDDGARIITRNGQIRCEYSYAADDLLSFDLSDDDCAVICTTSYSQEGRAEITLLNARGEATRNPLILADEPDSISYHDGRLAVLTNDTITFYNRSLRQIDEQSGYAAASRIYMRSGNLCIAEFSSHARVTTIGHPLEDLTEISSAIS